MIIGALVLGALGAISGFLVGFVLGYEFKEGTE